MWHIIIGSLFGILALGIPILWLICISYPTPRPSPMTYEEEIKWLISLGMTEQEAKEIIDTY